MAKAGHVKIEIGFISILLLIMNSYFYLKSSKKQSPIWVMPLLGRRLFTRSAQACIDTLDAGASDTLL
jgi:hypothetical protein